MIWVYDTYPNLPGRLWHLMVEPPLGKTAFLVAARTHCGRDLWRLFMKLGYRAIPMSSAICEQCLAVWSMEELK